MEDLFGKFAQDKKYSYDKHMFTTGHFQVISKFIDFFFEDIKTCKFVLDIATGTGIIPFELQKKSNHFNIIGIDKSESMIKIAKEKLPDINFMEKNLTNFPKNSFDLIIISYGVCWINFKRISKDIKRILKPNGKLLIIDDVDLENPLFFLRVPYLKTLKKYRTKISLQEMKKELLSKDFIISKEKILPVKNTHESYCLLAINSKDN